MTSVREMAFEAGSSITASASAAGKAAAASTGRRAPVLYLVNRYPAVTHTFIRREIAALEAMGRPVVRVAARWGGDLVDARDIAEQDRTRQLLGSRTYLLRSALGAAAHRPAGALRALGLCLRMMRRSDRSPLHHLIYLVEALSLARIARESGARHIHAHFGTNPAEVAMLAAAVSGLTYSFTVHGYDEYDRPQFLGLDRKIAGASFVAAVSHYGRSQLLRWCREEDRVKIHLVHCGLDLAEADAEVAEEASAGDEPAFVCVARMCREKAQETLVEAAALLVRRGRRFSLTLIGDGEARAAVEAAIRRQGLDGVVKLAGWADGAAVRRAMRAARALVVPSFAENLPVVIMEAMALEKPVIATAIAGIPELVIPGETGWLAPASSVEHLADAMEACLDAPEAELRRLGRAGRARVERDHDAAREAAKLAALFPAAHPDEA